MNNVIKYYYSQPLFEITMTTNPYNGQIVLMNEKPLRRYTMAVIYDDSDSTIKFGLSICMPNDNFNKSVGQTLAVMNAKNKPFYVINNFNGRRNDYADQVMGILKDKERNLLHKHYPQLFNEKNYM